MIDWLIALLGITTSPDVAGCLTLQDKLMLSAPILLIFVIVCAVVLLTKPGNNHE